MEPLLLVGLVVRPWRFVCVAIFAPVFISMGCYDCCAGCIGHELTSWADPAP